MIKTVSDRYVTVNIKTNYIEVRSAGGNYLDDLDKIKLTLLRYVRAMGLAADPEAEKKEYAKKLYKFLSPLIKGDDTDTLNWFSLYSAGALTPEELKVKIRRAETRRAAKKVPQSGDPQKNWIVTYQKFPDYRPTKMQVVGSSVEKVVRSFQERDPGVEIIAVADINAPDVNLLTRRVRAPGVQPSWLVSYQRSGGGTSSGEVYAPTRDAAREIFSRANPNLQILTVQAADDEVDLSDLNFWQIQGQPGTQQVPQGTTRVTARPGEPRPAFSAPSQAGTYIIRYLDTTGAAFQTAYDANSEQEARELFTGSHPVAYRIQSIQRHT
jgi:hypothetical protein